MEFAGFLMEEFSRLRFSWWAFGVTAVVVLGCGWMSVDRKRQWTLVIAELILFPATVGMIVPYLHLPVIVYILMSGAAFVISWGCHKSWSPRIEKVKGLGIRYHRDDKWWLNMELSGWLNLLYMTAQITMLGAYLLSPQIPATVVRKVWYLLILVSIVTVVKPAMMVGWRFSLKTTAKTAVTAVSLWVFIALATWIKLKL